MSWPRRTFPSAVDRILSRCVQDGDCWIYTGGLSSKGYCQVRLGDGSRHKQAGHRITWEAFIGPWPEGLTFDHLCRRKACVNPYHGEPVPALVNSQRAPRNLGVLNAAKTHCPQGHPLSGDNLRVVGGARVCRICRAESSRAFRLRKKTSA